MKIVTHLCSNHRKYSDFHNTKSTKYASDQLISDTLDFFRNGQFLADVVDLLMQITADALMLNLFIYQKNGEFIEVLNFNHPRADRVVRVKYIHNNLFPGGNHYDAIIHIQESGNNLDVLSKVASRMNPIQKHTPHYETQDVIDLTVSEDEDYIPSTHSPEVHFIKEEVASSPENIAEDGHLFSPPHTVTYFSTSQPNKYKKQHFDHDEMSGGSTDVYSHSDSTYVSSDLTDLEPSSSTSSTPATSPPLPQKNPTQHITTTHVLSSNSGSQSDVSEESSIYSTNAYEANELVNSISRGRPFPMWYFTNVEPQVVEAIPLDINGTQLYHIKASSNGAKPSNM